MRVYVEFLQPNPVPGPVRQGVLTMNNEPNGRSWQTRDEPVVEGDLLRFRGEREGVVNIPLRNVKYWSVRSVR